MTVDDIITGVVKREGGFVNHPDDRGGPTNWGITAATLGRVRMLGRAATVDEVRQLTQSEAASIYRKQYVHQPGFNEVPEPLRTQLIDFGVNSGPSRAIRWMQRMLHIRTTGIMDGHTWTLINELHKLGLLHLLNNSLVAARCYMVDRWTDADPTQKKFEEGVESRALSFLDFDRRTL